MKKHDVRDVALAAVALLVMLSAGGRQADAAPNSLPSFAIALQSAKVAPNQEALFECAADHFDGFEWFPDGWSANIFAPSDRVRFKQRAEETGMLTSVHAPVEADVCTATGREAIAESIGFARDVGATLVNIHLNSADDLTAYVRGLRDAINEATKRNIRIAIENTIATGPEDFNELFRRIRQEYRVDRGRVGMCLDIGHAYAYTDEGDDGPRMLNSHAAYARRLNPAFVPVIHAHFHENYGSLEKGPRIDTHRILLTGPAGENDQDLKNTIRSLRWRGFDGMVVLEQYEKPTRDGQPPTKQFAARQRLIKLFRAEGFAHHAGRRRGRP